MGHGRFQLHRAHALFNGAFHAQQTQTVLVFNQLAHGSHAPVAQVINIIHFAAAIFQIDDGAHNFNNIVFLQNPHGVRRIQAQTGIQLHTTHGGEVIALFVEKQAFEQSFRGLVCGGLARAHDAVNVRQGLFTAIVFIGHHRV